MFPKNGWGGTHSFIMNVVSL